MSSAPGGDQCACVLGTPKTPVTAAPQGGGSTPTSAPSSMMQKFKNAMTPTASNPGSTSFSACVAPYSPWNPPPGDLVKSLLNKLVTTTNYRTIMVYSLDQWIAGFAQAAGVKVLGIIYMTSDWTSNANNINLGVTAAKMYPDTVIAISCGNEAGMNLGATSSTAAIIQNCVTQVRQQGVKQPVGCIDTPGSWVQNGNPWTAASQGLDWIGKNIFEIITNTHSVRPQLLPLV
jgi:exo-beta-1,3-glucanase (GH17 family)